MEYLAVTVSHPSVPDVYSAVNKKDSPVSLATVYNTMSVLHRMGLIKMIEFCGDQNRYDTNTAPHINLICTSCGSTIDYEDDFSVRPDLVERKLGFHVTDYRMEYYGLCAQCRSHSKDTVS